MDTILQKRSLWPYTNYCSYYRKETVIALSDQNLLLLKKVRWVLKRGLFPAFRGLFLFSFFAGRSLPPLVGKGTTLLYKRMIRLGRWVFIGNYVSINAYSLNGISLGNRVTIREFGIIQCSSSVENPGVGLVVGNNVYIGPRCNIGVGGEIVIGEGTLVGADFTAVAENHLQTDEGISKVEVTRNGISIGKNCWIGHRVIILDGVTLGSNSIVGAGSVVTKSFPPGSKIAGIPARQL